MGNDEIIDKYYKEAVKGLNESVLEDQSLWYNYITSLPAHLQVVYNVVVFHQQVFNGGLHQYFLNGYGQFAYLALDNLKTIEAFHTAKILKRALNKVNDGQYTPDEFREKVFNRQLERISNFDEELGDALDDLDNEYYSLDEDLTNLLAIYLSQIQN